VATSSTPGLNVATDGSNHLSGFGYDAAGNMTNDGLYTYTYNAEGQQASTSAASQTYTYDGDGKRVMNSAGTYFWPTLSGDQLSDTPGAGAGNEYIFFAGRRIAWVDSSGTVRYYWGDHLGTTRIVTDAAGNVCYDADFYPFQGERAPYVSNCTPAYKFAGMKFDQESGDYYTLNRYYPPNLGRWMSPDPVAGSIYNPQSLNRYSYVLNNPCSLIDPLGLAPDCMLVIDFQANNLFHRQGEVTDAEDRIQSMFSQPQANANVGVIFSATNADFTVTLLPANPKPWEGVRFGYTPKAGTVAEIYLSEIATELQGTTDVYDLAKAVGTIAVHELATHAMFGRSVVPGTGSGVNEEGGWTSGRMLDRTLTLQYPGTVNKKCKEIRAKKRSGRGGGGGGVGGPWPSGGQIFGWVWTFGCSSGYHSDGTGHCVNDSPPGDY